MADGEYMRDLIIDIPDQNASVSGILEVPKAADCVLVLAHGAGAGMSHVSMTALSEALHAQNIGTLRYQFLYMERGSKRPDSANVAVSVVARAVAAAEKIGLPVFAGGRSFGGRMTTTAASLQKIPSIRGIVCFGFPLHPAKQPATIRAEHLEHVTTPTLFIQGTRDELADLDLIKHVVDKHRDTIKLHMIVGADHSFGVLKSSGRTGKEVLHEVVQACREFCSVHLGKKLRDP